MRPWIEDLGKVANAAAGVAMDMRRELEGIAARCVRQSLQKADLVTREEFEAVRTMAEKARAENEALAAKIAQLESNAAPSKRKTTKS
jgi:BMFP domain-containing protein YqiC